MKSFVQHSLGALLLIACAGTSFAQSPPPATPAVATPAPTASPTPVPAALIATEIEATSTRLRELDATNGTETRVKSVDESFKKIRPEASARAKDATLTLNTTPTLEALSEQETALQHIRDKLTAWNSLLAEEITKADRLIVELTAQQASWEETRTASRGSAPPEMIQRMTKLLDDMKSTVAKLGVHRGSCLKLQSALVEVSGEVDTSLTALTRARESVMARLLDRDSPPLWEVATLQPDDGTAIATEPDRSLQVQLSVVREFLGRQAGSLFGALIIALVLIAVLLRVREIVIRWCAADVSLVPATEVFMAPHALALLLTVCTAGILFPQAPRFFWAMVEALAIIPTMVIFRRTVDRTFAPVLFGLLVFYFADQVRLVLLAFPLLARLFFLVEMVLAAAFSVWFLRRYRPLLADSEHHGRIGRAIITAVRIAAVALLVAAISNAAGYTRLGDLVGNGVLYSAYTAMVLYAGIRVLDGLVFFALRIPPLALFRVVKLKGDVVRSTLHRVFLTGGLIGWAFLVTSRVSLEQFIIETITRVLNAPFGLGTLQVSLGALLTFAITAWATVALSRLCRFVLEEEFYPRAHLDRGVPYAISTVVHYCILLVGFFFALAGLGVDMTKFTILAGAFGVGLGFGLQNIINNFVSGLIVLFERPIRVGDVIQLDDTEGVVERIGIRASFLRTIHGSEVIVPNAKLISERVVNWTYSNRQRAIEIPLTLPLSVEAKRVAALLKSAAENHPLVAKDPAPLVVATKFGPESLTFELRAFTNRFLDWVTIRSELAMQIQTALHEAGIVTK